MKRAALFLLFAVIVFTFPSCALTGSNYENVKEMLSYPVCVNAVIEQETSIDFKIYVYENETLFTFAAPKTLSQLTVKKNNDGYKAQCDGLEIPVDRGSILAADALDIALDTVKTCDNCVQKTESGENVLLFSIDGNNVLVYYNKDTKKIDKIISEASGQLFTYKILSVEKINT